jgi:hypothetical protein
MLYKCSSLRYYIVLCAVRHWKFYLCVGARGVFGITWLINFMCVDHGQANLDQESFCFYGTKEYLKVAVFWLLRSAVWYNYTGLSEVGKILPQYMVQHCRRQLSSHLSMGETENSLENSLPCSQNFWSILIKLITSYHIYPISVSI